MVWIGPSKLRVVTAPTLAMSPWPRARRRFRRGSRALPAGRSIRRRILTGIFPSPFPGSGRRSAPCRRGRARGNPAVSGGRCRGFRRAVKTWCFGIRRPREMPCSGSPGWAGVPSMSLMPGQTPPLSCQPPPEPPIHSPSRARARMRRRSLSWSGPVRDSAWPVARMQHADEGGEQVGGDGEAGAFGDVVDAGDEFEAAVRAEHFREQIGRGTRRSLRCRAGRGRRR